jgi:hypothetical protein
MESQRPPRFLWNPRVEPCPALRPRGETHARRCGVSLAASTLKTVSASGTYSFRGSIARPSDFLCTLRSQGRPWTTQHSVPAGCQPLPGRLKSCRVPSEVFSRIFLYLTSNSSRLGLAHFQQNRPTSVSHDGELAGRKRSLAACAIQNIGANFLRSALCGPMSKIGINLVPLAGQCTRC